MRQFKLFPAEKLTFKQQTDILKYMGINKEDPCYRCFLGWSCQKVELLAMKIRELGLPPYDFQFYGNPENRASVL